MGSPQVANAPERLETASLTPISLASSQVIAWIAIFLASDLDSVIAQNLNFELPSWSALIRAVLLALMAVVVGLRARSPHLAGFIAALSALLIGDWTVFWLEANRQTFQHAGRSDRMLIGVFITLIPAALLALTLVKSGLSRQQVFLAKGDLHAPSQLPLLRGVRWSVVAPVLLAMLSGGLLVQLWIVSNGSRNLRPEVLLPALPAAILFAVINASSEEFRFRCVLLARGTRCIGTVQAIAATSVLFGLAHYNGHPSGFSGILMSAFFAWVVARSMVDTRGWGWAWMIHVVEDIIIFLMVRMTGV